MPLTDVHDFGILDGISAGFLVLDQQLKIVFWNRWMEKYSQKKASAVLQQPLLEVFPQLDPKSRLYQAIQANLDQGMPAVISNMLNPSPLPLFQKKQQQLQPICQHIQLSRVRMGRGENTRIYCLLYITDVSASVMREKLLEKHINERKIAEEALKEARHLAELSNHTKSQFMANISHETRTPLNGILGMVELLKNCDIDDEIREYVHIMAQSAQSLMSIIDEILDFSKIDSGNCAISKQPMQLMQLVHFIERIFRSKALEKGLTLHFDIDKNLPASVLGDKTRLQQILINLLDNAIKFTPQGRVSLKLDIAAEDERTIVIQFIVEDTGIGISEEDCKRIFESFSQADGSLTRQHGGMGLGLSITRQLVSLMGGDLSVESVPNEYTRFHFLLGFEKHQQQQDKSNSSLPQFSGHILLVENNQDCLKSSAQLLSKLGLQVYSVSSGCEALDSCYDQAFDLVFVSLALPEMDGYKLSSYFRAMEKTRKTGPATIIAITPSADEIDRIKCEQVGINDYISKPVQVEDLLRIMQLWLPKEPESGA